MKRTLCSALIAGLFAGLAHAGAPGTDAADAKPSTTAAAAAHAPVPASTPPRWMPAVRPQDDFFRYSQGKWLKDVEIPADRSSWGAFNVAAGQRREPDPHPDRSRPPQDKHAKAGSDGQKMGDYYASYVDEARRNALGLAPLEGRAGARGRAEGQEGASPRLAAHFDRIGAGAPVDLARPPGQPRFDPLHRRHRASPAWACRTATSTCRTTPS